jgi:glycyl-tRNA synthetase beta chain
LQCKTIPPQQKKEVMMQVRDLLIEIGTEELPPRALKPLAEVFAQEVHAGLEQLSLLHEGYKWFATPRRLSVVVQDLVLKQADHEVVRRGPALSAAFDESGNATPAAEGFARSCGSRVKDLEQLENKDGAWLIYKERQKGQKTSKLLPGIIDDALRKLPIPKRMRWGDLDVEFVRPVHWCVVLLGKDTVPCQIMGVSAGNTTRGHRFHYPKVIRLTSASQYLDKLRDPGMVMADFTERRDLIEKLVKQAAKKVKSKALISSELLDEVTALVEWPVAVTGSFDKTYLKLPSEVLIATMQDHQKYFPVTNNKGDRLQNHFITISNIKSRTPARVRQGNERVILPRLADAEFFWNRDCSKRLEDYGAGLKDIIFQNKLGTLADKILWVENLSVSIARKLEHPKRNVGRAARLAKCDLLTEMVGEFPQLQGIMGYHYALNSGENEEVAKAIDEQYLPRHAGDVLPETISGQILSIADKIDTIVGIFAIGQVPTGDRDPFALRRAAIGVLRILAECQLPLDLHELIDESIRLHPKNILSPDTPDSDTVPLDNAVQHFFTERARYMLRDKGYSAEEVEAVLDLYSNRPIDYLPRLEAVRSFMTLPEAAGLMFQAEQERALYDATRRTAGQVNSYIESGKFNEALKAIANLHEPVTEFFDNVMVNVEDEGLRNNRFALLHNLADLTNRVANISKLAT